MPICHPMPPRPSALAGKRTYTAFVHSTDRTTAVLNIQGAPFRAAGTRSNWAGQPTRPSSPGAEDLTRRSVEARASAASTFGSDIATWPRGHSIGGERFAPLLRAPPAIPGDDPRLFGPSTPFGPLSAARIPPKCRSRQGVDPAIVVLVVPVAKQLTGCRERPGYARARALRRSGGTGAGSRARPTCIRMTLRYLLEERRLTLRSAAANHEEERAVARVK
jgi:hypothetical protein